MEEYGTSLIEEFFKLCIILLTELPVDTQYNLSERNNLLLRREIIHQLAIADCTRSEIARAVSVTGEFAKDQLSYILDQVGESSRTQNTTKKFRLLPKCVMEYDPTFYHHSRQQNQESLEHVLAVRKAWKKQTMIESLPIVGVPIQPHPYFTCVRRMVINPGLFAVMRICLTKLLKKIPQFSSETILSRIIHIVTLQTYYVEDLPSNHNDVRKFVEEICFPYDGASIFEILLKLDTSKNGVITADGIKWLVEKLSQKYPECAKKFSRSDRSSSDNKTSNRPSNDELRKKAQERAMQRLKEKQQTFAMKIESDGRLKELDLQNQEENLANSNSSGFGTESLCIMCHEQSPEVLCAIGFAQKSKNCYHMMRLSPNQQNFKNIYMVTANSGCRVRAAPELNSSCITLLPLGTELTIHEIRGRQALIILPVEGWISLVNVDTQETVTPIFSFLNQLWGSQDIYLSFCGHFVHENCWGKYIATQFESNSMFENHSSRFSFDIKSAEYLCPLCKSISNILVPCIPQTIARTLRLSSVTDNDITLKLNDHNNLYEWIFDSTQLERSLHTSIKINDIPNQLINSMYSFATSLGNIENTKKFPSIKFEYFHMILCSFASTIQNMEMSGRYFSNDVNGNPFTKETDFATLQCFAMALRILPCLTEFLENPSTDISEEEKFMNGFIAPLIRLVRGEPVGLGAQDRIFSNLTVEKEEVKTLLTFPLPTVFDTLNNYSSSNFGARYSVMKSLAEKRILPSDVIYGLFEKPLLSWNLTVLATTFVGCIGCLNDLKKSLQIVCIARLIQILISPSSFMCIQPNSTIVEPNLFLNEELQAIEQLQKIVFQECGIEHQQNFEPINLLKMVYSKWIPLLRTCVLILKVTTPTNLDIEWKLQLDDPSILCETLGLGSIREICESDFIILIRKWCKQLISNDNIQQTEEEKEQKIKVGDILPNNSSNYDDGNKSEHDNKDDTKLDSLLDDNKNKILNNPQIESNNQNTLSKFMNNTEFHLPPLFSNITGSSVHTGIFRLHSKIFELSQKELSLNDKPNLIPLPYSFTELYAGVKNKHLIEAFDPAICLICGCIIPILHKDSTFRGQCTHHAASCGAGVGIFFLVQRCGILLIRSLKAAFYPSIYVDEYGEEDSNLKRGMPLYLSTERYKELEKLYFSHAVASTITTIKHKSDYVVYDNYF